MHTLNLGILAHVDAGKTSLTERLLHAAGVIDEIGSVDDGSTQTDSLALERRRGITIKSAVVSFAVGGVTVNLIDTPGHPDFIAEVERVLSVLDGAVLVISAVEGVQAQTRVLMRALQRLRIPTILFVNKVDRSGAREDDLVAEIAAKLSPAVIAMGTVEALGTRAARVVPGVADARLTEVLAEHDDGLLAAYVTDGAAPPDRLRAALSAQTRRGQVYPVYFGSAITGAGLAPLVDGIVELLPGPPPDPDAPVSGTVFKVDRGPAGEKLAYVRMFEGTVRVRDRLPYTRGAAKVTGISVFDGGAAVRADEVTAGRIGLLAGLPDIRIGDAVGQRPDTRAHRFAPPTLETVVAPCDPRDRGRLHLALTQLAEQDPLIDLRQDDVRRELSVSLYGEVQKEVLEATLAEEHGVRVTFRESTTICVERVRGVGEAVEVMDKEVNPFLAGIGLRVEPGPVGGGFAYRLGIEPGTLPLAFQTAIAETVPRTLHEGLRGWRVVDCVVTLVRSQYAPRQSHAHATFDKSLSSTAGDFRLLTPLVLMTALRRAGTVVCEPMHRLRLEAPPDTFGAVMSALNALDAVPLSTGGSTVDGLIPAARVHALQQRLPSLTRGEGLLESAFDHYRPVRGEPPARPRTDHNPLDRKEYLLHVQRRV